VTWLTQLEIDECISWIRHSIDFDKNSSCNYASAEDWEFLVFGAKDYYMDVNSLRKIEKTTGMVLVQIKSCNGIAEVWFGRRKIEVPRKNYDNHKNLRNRAASA
jgi:hypothetical protein